jgi:gliding motility-associated-like protein
MRQVFFLLWISGLLCQEILSQPLVTRNNHSGNWEDPDSWDPVWDVPNDTIYGTDTYINGFITVNSSLCITGAACDLIINDTLVINGDLSLGNLSTLYVNENAILIVKGSLSIINKSIIITSGYLVVTGDFANTSATWGGSFVSNSNPSKVFIAGTVPSLNNISYPAINCTFPVTIPYPNSACSYGNRTDLMNDPIYSFFQSTQVKAMAVSNSPLCEGSNLNLSASGGTSYIWSGPNGFASNEQNPSVAGATLSMSGVYNLTVTDSNGFTDTTSLLVVVNENPIADAGSNQVLNNVFETRMEALLAEGETGEWAVVTGQGVIQDPGSPTTWVTGLSEGENTLMWTVSNENCEASESVTLTVYDALIPSVITPNGDNKNDFFILTGKTGPIELIVFNRWGLVEYSSDDYLNDWGGRNNKGVELQDDTYFYVVKYSSGEIKKGTVLIKSR